MEALAVAHVALEGRPGLVEKLTAAETAVTERRALYADHLAAGLMSAEHAAREIAAMEAIAADYRAELRRGVE